MIDAIVVLLFLTLVVRGQQLGLIRQVLSAGGFFGGLFLGAGLQPHLLHYATTPLARAVLALGFTLGCAFVCLSIAEYVGTELKTRLLRFRVDKVDGGLGAVAGGISCLATIWLIAPILISLPYPSLQQAVRSSWIVAKLDRTLPTAPNVVADIGHVIYPNGYPQVFTGLEPSLPLSTPLPDLGMLNEAVQKDQASVVKIEGRGCGGIVEGSGFVADKDVVLTNAHVVAGVTRPIVLDNDGKHTATAIWFDPNLDLAILRVNGLADPTLAIKPTVAPAGTASAILGYPSGGGFAAAPASILQTFTAIGRNIYGQGHTSRDVYAIKGTVIPGNSGGPLVDSSGQVIGVIFAASTTYNQVGYALTTPQVVSEFHQAEAANTPISTDGQCAE